MWNNLVRYFIFLLVSLWHHAGVQAQDTPNASDKVNVRDDFHIALIGVEDYVSAGNLSGPARDLCALYQTYVHEIGVPPSRIRIYLGATRFDAASPCRGVDVVQATKSSVIAGLRQQTTAAHKKSTFIVHFSGHGIERDGRQLLWLSESGEQSGPEAALMSLRELAQALQTTKDFPSTVAIFLDACRDSVLTASSSAVNTETAKNSTNSGLAQDLTGFEQGVVFSSAKSEQRSYIRPHYALGKPVNPISYFSWVSVKALLGMAEYTTNYISASVLGAFLSDEVPQMLNFEFQGKGLQQNPTPSWLNESSRNIRLPARERSLVPKSFYFFSEIRLSTVDTRGLMEGSPYSVDIALSRHVRSTTEYAAITPRIYDFPGPFVVELPKIDLAANIRWRYKMKLVFMFHLWRSEFIVCDSSPNLPSNSTRPDVVTLLRDNQALVIDARKAFAQWGRQIDQLIDQAASAPQKFTVTRVENASCAH